MSFYVVVLPQASFSFSFCFAEGKKKKKASTKTTSRRFKKIHRRRLNEKRHVRLYFVFDQRTSPLNQTPPKKKKKKKLVLQVAQSTKLSSLQSNPKSLTEREREGEREESKP